MSDRVKALERIQKLLRLATQNPNEAEATSAAVQAVKLIAEHSFTVGDVSPPHQPQPVPFQSPWPQHAPWEYQYAANQRTQERAHAQSDYDAMRNMWADTQQSGRPAYLKVTMVDDDPQPPKRKRWGIL